ncbi:MAG: P1 family peptidase, partial [Hymenobacteraceae bacterium]|nr:P1 family peptidase [Hymenobacteraceae bacterium]MDX5395774.1 P1 family peptidase [Hymenobacteraceae bacterium]MDX5511829.1 P1 family peptidase [Hymenobacteraceae bacterium]
MKKLLILPLLLCSLLASSQTTKPRARDLGIPFDGVTGKNNAITDVDGVLVGYKTLFRGAGALETGKGPVRTGVTVILPKGKT